MPTETTGHIPYPLGTDPVKDGDNAMQAMALALDPAMIAGNVGKGFRPLVAAGAAIANPSAYPIVGPARIYVQHTQITTDSGGHFNLSPPGFKVIFFASVTAVGAGLIFDLDAPNSVGLASTIMFCRNPATGAVLPNRVLEYIAVVIGL